MIKKRIPFFFGIVFALLMHVSTAFGYIYNLTNMSAEWIRTGNRNAATDSTDIINYNPAGISELSQGFHLNLYGIFQKQNRKLKTSDETGENKYNESDTINSFPGAYGVYNINKWSVFGGIDLPNGGTKRRYSKGSVATHLAGRTIFASPLVDSGYNILTSALNLALTEAPYNFLKIGNDGSGDKQLYSDISNEKYDEEFQYQLSTLGFAYKFNKIISFAMGFRFVNADSTTIVSLDLSKLSDDAIAINSLAPGLLPEKIRLESVKKWLGWGTGGIFSINLNTSENINLAMQIQTPVKLIERCLTKKDELNLFPGEKKQRRDLPGIIGVGLGYDISKKLYLGFDFNYWFQSKADWEKVNGKSIASMAGDAWKTGATMSYNVTPAFLISFGGAYTKYQWNNLSDFCSSKTGISEALLTDNVYLGTGFSFEIVKNIKVNFGIAHTIFKKENYSIRAQKAGFEVSTDNDSTIMALGLDISL